MEQLSNEEKAKVFAMYLNETTKVETKYSTRQLVGVSIFDQTVDVKISIALSRITNPLMKLN